jgi:CRP-like cAMP-binding protein
MIRILGDEILHNQELILLLGKKTAEERLAAFLLVFTAALQNTRARLTS